MPTNVYEVAHSRVCLCIKMLVLVQITYKIALYYARLLCTNLCILGENCSYMLIMNFQEDLKKQPSQLQTPGGMWTIEFKDGIRRN